MRDDTNTYHPLKEFPNILACRAGYLINARTGQVIRGSVKETGYVEVALRDEEGLVRYKQMHRMIAETFCEKKPGADEVNHINGIKTDNSADNLEWVTRNENLRHAFETGLRSDDVSARAVIGQSIETGESMKFHSIYSAARFLGISQGNICMCCKGERSCAGGYYWRYEDGET